MSNNSQRADRAARGRPPTPSAGVMSRESSKIFQIMAEFVSGFEQLSQIQPSVSIFGSARIPADHPYYALSERSTRKLSDAGSAVVSGGGPGLMEAANKGATAANRRAAGSISAAARAARE